MQRFHRRRKIDVRLFRGRYRAVLIDADQHLLEVLRYTHRNPVHAGLAEALGIYRWSSHNGYVSGARKWHWLDKDFLLSMLAEEKRQTRRCYLDFVSRSESAEIERFYSLKNLPPPSWVVKLLKIGSGKCFSICCTKEKFPMHGNWRKDLAELLIWYAIIFK